MLFILCLSNTDTYHHLLQVECAPAILGDNRHLSQSALEKLTMNEDEKSFIKTWKAETDTNL